MDQFAVLISTLLHTRNQTQIFHWGTTGPGSYAQHMALGTFYDEIVGLVDSLVESYQGKYGIVSGYKNVKELVDYTDITALLNYYNAIAIFIEKVRERIPQDTYIQNQMDTIYESVMSLTYKLKFLS